MTAGQAKEGQMIVTIVVSAEELAALNRHMEARLIILATGIDKKDAADIVLARVHQAALKAIME